MGNDPSMNKPMDTMDTVQKMKLICDIFEEYEKAKDSLEAIADSNRKDFLKYATEEEKEELRAKIKARYEVLVSKALEEAKKMLGESV